MSHKRDQVNFYPSLVFTRLFGKPPELSPKPINFDKEPSTSIDNDQNKKLQDTNNLIPDIGYIDDLALRCTPRIRTKLDKAIEYERQAQTIKSNSITGSFK